MDDEDKRREVDRVGQIYAAHVEVGEAIIDLFMDKSMAPVHAEIILLTLAGLSIGMRAGSLQEPHVMAGMALGWMKGAKDGA